MAALSMVTSVFAAEPPPTGPDLSQKGQDDRPPALHVRFEADRSEADLWDRLVRGIKTDISGIPLSGRVLTYARGGSHAPGSKIVNPHTGRDGILLVLRDGRTPTERWLGERVDFGADFEMAFGEPAPGARFIALSADADDTGTRSVGRITDIVFSAD